MRLGGGMAVEGQSWQGAEGRKIIKVVAQQKLIIVKTYTNLWI